MAKRLDQRYDGIVSGGHEKTVFLSRKKVERTIERSRPRSRQPPRRSRSGTRLWDPVPITMPTYVSKPLAPRTVRTIDLSGPQVATPAHPVTADAPEQPEVAAEARDSLPEDEAGSQDIASA